MRCVHDPCNYRDGACTVCRCPEPEPPKPTIPPGWRIERANRGPMRMIRIHDPYGGRYLVGQTGPTYERVLFDLADAILENK